MAGISAELADDTPLLGIEDMFVPAVGCSIGGHDQEGPAPFIPALLNLWPDLSGRLAYEACQPIGECCARGPMLFRRCRQGAVGIGRLLLACRVSEPAEKHKPKRPHV